jgi:molecular chaperone HscB
MRRADVVVGSHSMYKEDQNPFEILGIAATFDVAAAALDEAYFARQSLVHPDRFIYHSEPERQVALVQSASINRAYETLKTPALRAKALLTLRGIDMGQDASQTVQDPQVLEEMMLFQEALMEAVSPHDLTHLESQILEQLEIVKTSFSDELQQNNNEKLLGLFLRLTYLSKLLGDLQARRRQSSVKVL